MVSCLLTIENRLQISPVNRFEAQELEPENLFRVKVKIVICAEFGIHTISICK